MHEASREGRGKFHLAPPWNLMGNEVEVVPTGRPLISLLNASFLMGDRLVFENSSWCLRQGEQWAILGPNNSGKSLLADGLRGLLPVAHGEIQYHFRPFPNLSAEECIVHVSFDERRLNLHQTVVQSRWNSIEEEGALRVREYLSYERVMDINPFEVTDRHLKARPQFEKRLRRAVRLLKVESFWDRVLLSLSNGETQRVQLVRALAHPTRLLILDEPFAGLDVGTRIQVHRTLEQLMSSGVHVVLITTRPEDLPKHVTHILCLEDCRIIAAGPRSKLLHRSDIRALLAAPQPGSTQIHEDLQRGASSVRKRLLSPNESKNPPGTASDLHDFHRGSELVRMQDVTVRYGESVILRHINWTVHERESWALLGENGSGKTALLSLILHDNPQVYGNDVSLFGRPSGPGESIWQLKRRIGWVSPELHLYLNGAATCLEVVLSGFTGTMGLFQAPSASQRRTGLRWLELLHLGDYAENQLFTLSAGIQRMVLLARALVREPRLLILDEPCQGLDAGHRRLFVETVDELIRKKNLTTIFVTHRRDEIPGSIHQVLRLKRGRATHGRLR